MNIDADQYVTQSQIAAMKGMSLPLLAHHLGKPDAPRPVLPRLYSRGEVEAWQPLRMKKTNNRRNKP